MLFLDLSASLFAAASYFETLTVMTKIGKPTRKLLVSQAPAELMIRQQPGEERVGLGKVEYPYVQLFELKLLRGLDK